MNTKKVTLINKKMSGNKILVLSNDIAEYPPKNLTMHEWQALIALSAPVNSSKKPIRGLDEIKEVAKARGITTKEGEHLLLQEMMIEQRTYEQTFDEFFSYYSGDTPLSRKTKHDLIAAVESLSTKVVVTASNNEMYASFNWIDTVIIDKKERIIKYLIGVTSQNLLMGLTKNFLQMMARISVKEARKYDIPIFIHMKSKLHSNKDSFASVEPIDDFKNRFGHDEIASYSSWKDYYRRVLKPAEQYGAGSNDIAYTFEGKARRGRKITHIHYKIWRTGNIHKPQLGEGNQADLFAKERRKRWDNILAKMPEARYRGFEFLKAEGVNKGFLLDECMLDNCLRHEAVIGFEDLFLQKLWQRLCTYSKAQKKAGAFVTWWRRGKLTDGDHYWATIENLIKHKKTLPQEQVDLRHTMAMMPRSKYKEYLKRQNKTSEHKPTLQIGSKKGFTDIGSILPNTKKPITVFDYDVFKKEHSQEHQKIENDLFNRLIATHDKPSNGVDLDKDVMREIEKQLKQILPQHCEKWYQDNV